MTAKETWENPSGATVQQVVGSAASELTAKASGLKTAAAAHVNMERVQHYVGTGAWKLANVVSKVAYHAASKVSSMTLPVDAGNAEDGITVTRQDIGPGMSMMVVQQAQNADDIREPLLNGFRMEGTKAERDDEERKNLLDEFLETIGPDTDVGCRHSTAQVHSDQKHHATTIKTLGSLHEDEELLRKRRLRQYCLGVRIPMNDDLTNPAYGNNIQDPKQVQHGGSLRAESYSKNEPGPRFTEDEGPYDNLGVSNVWNNPRKKLVSEEEKKALAQRWQSQEDRSARDRGSRKVDAKKDAQPSYIPVRVTRGPRAIDSADKEEEVKQGKTWVAGMNRGALIIVSLLSPQRLAIERSEAIKRSSV